MPFLLTYIDVRKVKFFKHASRMQSKTHALVELLAEGYCRYVARRRRRMAHAPHSMLHAMSTRKKKHGFAWRVEKQADSLIKVCSLGLPRCPCSCLYLLVHIFSFLCIHVVLLI